MYINTYKFWKTKLLTVAASWKQAETGTWSPSSQGLQETMLSLWKSLSRYYPTCPQRVESARGHRPTGRARPSLRPNGRKGARALAERTHRLRPASGTRLEGQRRGLGCQVHPQNRSFTTSSSPDPAGRSRESRREASAPGPGRPGAFRAGPCAEPVLPPRTGRPGRFTEAPWIQGIDAWKSERAVVRFQIQNRSRGERAGLREGKRVYSPDANVGNTGTLQGGVTPGRGRCLAET